MATIRAGVNISLQCQQVFKAFAKYLENQVAFYLTDQNILDSQLAKY